MSDICFVWRVLNSDSGGSNQQSVIEKLFRSKPLQDWMRLFAQHASKIEPLMKSLSNVLYGTAQKPSLLDVVAWETIDTAMRTHWHEPEIHVRSIKAPFSLNYSLLC